MTCSPRSATWWAGARSYEKVLASAREAALEAIEADAAARGAQAIIGLGVDYEVVGDKGSMLMVVATGTAVKLSG